MSFEDLESQQAIHAKNILIYFYADWCTYCKKMDRVSFASLDNTTLIEKHYYAVKFNVESPEEVQFQEGIFRNKDLNTHRNPVHDIAKHFLKGREDAYALPALLILDKTYKVLDAYFTYLSPQDLKAILSYYSL